MPLPMVTCDTVTRYARLSVLLAHAAHLQTCARLTASECSYVNSSVSNRESRIEAQETYTTILSLSARYSSSRHNCCLHQPASHCALSCHLHYGHLGCQVAVAGIHVYFSSVLGSPKTRHHALGEVEDQ
jgi:hypothetical protein